MPELLNIINNNTCFLCGSQAFYVSFNSKKMRCTEKITQCPGFIKKAKETRDKNITREELCVRMKHIGERGNNTLRNLHKNTDWVNKKGKNIAMAIATRGGHSKKNNPMYGKHHTFNTKQNMSIKATARDISCYSKATDTKIKNGIAVPKEQKTQLKLYQEQVSNHTRKSWNHYQSIINPNNLPRGKDFELDHKFSITAGFINMVPPEVIGHHMNLELLPTQLNRSKRIKCSIKLVELYRQVFNNPI